MKKSIVMIVLMLLVLALPVAAVTEIKGGFSKFNTPKQREQGHCYFDALKGTVCPGLQLKQNLEFRAFPKRTRRIRYERIPMEYRGSKVPHYDPTTVYLISNTAPSTFIIKGSPSVMFPRRNKRTELKDMRPLV